MCHDGSVQRHWSRPPCVWTRRVAGALSAGVTLQPVQCSAVQCGPTHTTHTYILFWTWLDCVRLKVQDWHMMMVNKTVLVWSTCVDWHICFPVRARNTLSTFLLMRADKSSHVSQSTMHPSHSFNFVSKSLWCELVRVADLQPGDVRTNFVLQNSDADALSTVDVAGGELVLDPEDVVDAARCSLCASKQVTHWCTWVVDPRDQLFGVPTSVPCVDTKHCSCGASLCQPASFLRICDTLFMLSPSWMIFV